MKSLTARFSLAFFMGTAAPIATPAKASAQVPASASAPVTLVVDFAPGTAVDRSRLRDAVAKELGVPVVWERGGAGGTLVVRQEGARIVVSFDRSDGRHDGRSLPLASDPARAEREMALLAGNVARDQTSQFEPAPPGILLMICSPDHDEDEGS